MPVIRSLIIFVFFLILVLLPQSVFAATTPYRSAGWVATTGNPSFTNLGNCQATDGLYCSRPSANSFGSLFFSSFGTFSDFGIPQNSLITKVHLRITGKSSDILKLGVGTGKNNVSTNMCQSPFDLWWFYLGSTNTIKEYHTAFVADPNGNGLFSCLSPTNVNLQNYTFYINDASQTSTFLWSADIDNFEIAFDYSPGPTPTPTNTPTLTPTSTPTPTPTPTPSEQIVFVHGLNTSFQDVQGGGADFKTIIKSLPAQNEHIFPYYQDLAYKLESGNCENGLGNPQPTPDTSVGPLHAHPDSVDPTFCDSQSAIAYNSTGLDNFLSSIQSPIAIVNYSMGATITHGWLTLAQSRANDQALSLVNTIISLQGAYEGSYLAKAGQYLLHKTDWSNPIQTAIVSTATSLWGVNASRPAENDLTPQSEWYQSANTSVPSTIHYFNFFSDIQITARPKLFFVSLPPLGTTSVGDTVLLPGEDDPTALPAYGGSRFLPGGEAQDRHQYVIAKNYDVSFGDDILNPVITNPLIAAGVALQIQNDPATHFNLNNYLNDGVIKIDSCKSGIGQVTIQTEILRILNDPAHACDL